MVSNEAENALTMQPLGASGRGAMGAMGAMVAMVCGKYRRRRGEEDAFFDLGNAERNEFYRYVGDGDGVSELNAGESNASLSASNDDDAGIVCAVDGCEEVFSSLSRYEVHYRRAHMHQCATCAKSFCSERLLGMHISERHDHYFKVMSEKKASYACLVDGCADLFWCDKERQVHLCSVHRYPPPLRAETKKKCQRKSEREHERCAQKTMAATQDRRQPSGAAMGSMEDAAEGAAQSDRMEIPGHGDERIPDGNSRKNSAKYRTKACKHFVKLGYCHYGDKCHFLHDPAQRGGPPASAPATTAGAAGADMDMDVCTDSADVEVEVEVEALSEQLATSLRFVPSTVSFGRKKRSNPRKALS